MFLVPVLKQYTNIINCYILGQINNAFVFSFNFKPYAEYATKMFLAEDGDHDGQLSIAETVASFRRYDANGKWTC